MHLDKALSIDNSINSVSRFKLVCIMIVHRPGGWEYAKFFGVHKSYEWLPTLQSGQSPLFALLVCQNVAFLSC